MAYIYNPFTGNLDAIKSASVGTGDNISIEYFVLTAAQAASKEVQLLIEPKDPASVLLIIIGGTAQVNGEDFQVVGDVVTWDGLALELTLETDDKILIQYTN